MVLLKLIAKLFICNDFEFFVLNMCFFFFSFLGVLNMGLNLFVSGARQSGNPDLGPGPRLVPPLSVQPLCQLLQL